MAWQAKESVIKQSIICTFNQLLPTVCSVCVPRLQFTVIVFEVDFVLLLLRWSKASYFVYHYTIALQLTVAIIVIASPLMRKN